MLVNKHAEMLADWLHAKRRAGGLCPSNLVPPAAAALGLTIAQVKAARDVLRKTGRFMQNNFHARITIDGLPFTGVRDDTTVDRVKDLLRKKFRCSVIDSRTIKFPKSVPVGIPDCLYIGSRKVPWEQAVEFVSESLDGPVREYLQSARRAAPENERQVLI